MLLILNCHQLAVIQLIPICFSVSFSLSNRQQHFHLLCSGSTPQAAHVTPEYNKQCRWNSTTTFRRRFRRTAEHVFLETGLRKEEIEGMEHLRVGRLIYCVQRRALYCCCCCYLNRFGRFYCCYLNVFFDSLCGCVVESVCVSLR